VTRDPGPGLIAATLFAAGFACGRVSAGLGWEAWSIAAGAAALALGLAAAATAPPRPPAAARRSHRFFNAGKGGGG
jgi:hypothetical protein